MLQAALSALYYTRADEIVAPFTRGQGAIFMLHRVTPEAPRAFEPNRILKVTPDFIERVIHQVVQAGFEILTLDEVPERLRSGGRGRPFACFTFDDGYRDNLEHAYPIFRRLGVPFTIYVPGDYPDGRGDLWWLMLERVIERSDEVRVELDGDARTFATRTTAAKERAFEEIYWRLRGMDELQARAIVASLASPLGLSSEALCRELIMTWDEIRRLAADPLVTIGAHTMRHLALSKLDADTARREIADSIARIEAETGRPCRHFSYPYGCVSSAGEREFAIAAGLGLATAVTTRKGLVQKGDADRLTALARFSLNGDYQDTRFVKVMLTGVPFAIWNAVSRENVASPMA